MTVPLLANFTGGEILMIAGFALMFFGAKKVPDLMRGVGNAVREFKRITGSMQNDVRRALDEVQSELPKASDFSLDPNRHGSGYPNSGSPESHYTDPHHAGDYPNHPDYTDPHHYSDPSTPPAGDNPTDLATVSTEPAAETPPATVATGPTDSGATEVLTAGAPSPEPTASFATETSPPASDDRPSQVPVPTLPSPIPTAPVSAAESTRVA